MSRQFVRALRVGSGLCASRGTAGTAGSDDGRTRTHGATLASELLPKAEMCGCSEAQLQVLILSGTSTGTWVFAGFRM